MRTARGGLSENSGLPWSLELIERFCDRWSWWWLSKNAALPWSLRLIERFEDHWNWSILSQNATLPWSLELIERFEDRWDWTLLSSNTGAILPLLHPTDIVEIMTHHLAEFTRPSPQ